jgi:hypothetical protein
MVWEQKLIVKTLKKQRAMAAQAAKAPLGQLNIPVLHHGVA